MMKDEEEKRPSKLVSNDFRQTTVLRSNSIVVAVVNNNNNKTQKMHIFRPLIDNLQSEEIVICDQAQQISHLMSSVILAIQQSTSSVKANIMSLNQKHFVEKRTVKYVMLMNNNNNSNNNNLKSNNNEAQETQISRKLVVVTKQKHRPIVSNSILEPLIKMAMFLISLTCLQLFGVHLERANCQRILRNSHYNNQQPFHPSSANTFASTTTQPQNRIVMNQQQRQTTFDQLLRTAGNNVNNDITLENYNNQFINHQSSNNNNNNQYHPQVFNQQRPAERRVSGVVQQLTQQPMNINQQQQQSSVSNNKDTNKMLVCFYTTRQSAPYWPKDSREYVIPADSINSITGATDFTQATFAPILQYEPFNNMKSNSNSNTNSALVVNNNDGLPQQQQQQSSSDFDVNAQMKNQQQQLVFKSSSMQQQQLPPLQLLGGQLFNSISSNSANNNNGNVANNAKQHQDAISQMLAVAEQQLNSPAQQQQQQTLVITSSTTGDNSANKNKQTPTYSFIGDLDATSNNGLIVNANSNANGNVGSIAPTLSNTLSQTNNNNNIANNFVINKDKNAASGVTSSPLKQQQQQQQQLLFSPSLSRAFIVANSLGPTGNGNLNNEVLDTKSQLFVHNSQQAQQQQQNNNNNNIQYHQQTAFQQSAEQAATQQKGKSLKSAIGDQVSGANTNANNAVLQFSGSISSASPVPLSSASSSSSPNSALLLQSPSQQPNYRSPIPNFSSALDSGNQLVINNAANQPGIQTALKSPGAVSFSSNGSGSSAALKLPYAAGLLSNSEAAKVSSSSSSSALPISSSQSGSLTLTNGPINSSSSQPLSSSLSSTLVSSPLSTMFDVFGAASQYLMRFKPSSLMSPATLSFNTLSNPDNNRHHHHHHHHQQQQQQTNQQTTNKTLSNSLIPLPFASSLVSSIHKSSSSLTSNNDRSSSQSSQSVGSKILSRFSLQNTQRREDVCGRTIQTPERRIIGGEGAKYGEFPYQVHIKIAKHQCGGALVDRQSIVTAAHCVYHFITRAPVSKLQIVIGAYDIEDEQYQELPPQYFKVNKVKLHPNFRFSASHPDRYDIAILKLDKPVKYTDNVLPVCLPNKDLKFESVVGTVTGFGKTDPSLSNRYGTRLLQKVDVPIIENNECERWHRTRGIDLKIFPEMMCAGYEDGLKDACVGDSGGPLVVKTAVGSDGSFRWTLAGITSAGFGCAQSRQPGIYHRVSHTVDWILENLD